jgi:hypothetical protein
MANKSKKAVKAELQELGIAVTTDDYKTLCSMLKDATDSVDEAGDTSPLIGKPIGQGSTQEPAPKLDPESDHPVIKRAIKIGMLPERIALFTDITELERQCQLIKPQSTVKPAEKAKKQVIRGGYIIKGKPATLECTVEMTEARSMHVARCNYDEGQLADFLRLERIDPRCINKLNFDRQCVPKKGMLVTVITIDYMKE